MKEPVLLSGQHLDEVRQCTRDLRQALLPRLYLRQNTLKLLLDDVHVVLAGILKHLCHTHDGVVCVAQRLPGLIIFVKGFLKVSSEATQVLIRLIPPFF